ncbi:hypothetical protein GIB67_000702 [Kingdonia uniflora]|uniref:Uncharacterized protein n=1 Tax=Kingdonia uniflora TaxID=39325 RepID=A0A7J7NE19_9MAGN|nr:hypothetical protein GIB67_000702 [Kingdonia uniflora]
MGKVANYFPLDDMKTLSSLDQFSVSAEAVKKIASVGTRYEMLEKLSKREKGAGIKPDPEIDAFMKAIVLTGQETSLITNYILKILGSDICADIMVGDDMRRGISGG